jgi:hypothetical protein
MEMASDLKFAQFVGAMPQTHAITFQYLEDT